MITRIDPDQRLWLRQFIQSSGKPAFAITWDESKSALVQTYGLTIHDHKIKANEELHPSYFNEHKEAIEQFLDRFHALSIRSDVHDSHVLISYLLRVLPSNLVRTVNITFASVSANDNSVDFV